MAEYDVGYGKPPKHTQFTKGRSGNPRGRQRGSKNLATIIDEELTRPVTVVENGKRTKISKIQAAIRQVANKAMMADPKALRLVLMLVRSRDSWKSISATKPKPPRVEKGMSLEESAEAWMRQLRGF
jgi:hypothetical protein